MQVLRARKCTRWKITRFQSLKLSKPKLCKLRVAGITGCISEELLKSLRVLARLVRCEDSKPRVFSVMNCLWWVVSVTICLCDELSTWRFVCDELCTCRVVCVTSCLSLEIEHWFARSECSSCRNFSCTHSVVHNKDSRILNFCWL